MITRGLALAVVAALASVSALTGQGAATGRGNGPAPQGAEVDLPLVERFDRNGDGRLDHAERTTTRAYLAANPEARPPRRAPRLTRVGTPGERLTLADVPTYSADVSLYDPSALRTLLLEFANDDWEQELSAFWHTDVEVAATLTVDGKSYADVGVAFRGNNSFTAVPDGLKRSLSIKIDFVHDQTLLGYRELKLLNANDDPTFLRTPLYLDVAREYIPGLRANFVRVVINGESWGVYVNQQAFDKTSAAEAFGGEGGTRWKSPNNSVGGGLSYLGPDVAAYRRWYEMKGKDDPQAWAALIEVCRVLAETPPELLEAALEPILDVDGALRFLALDVALLNNDGYWNDGSDYNLYLDERGRLHLTPHDVNEGLRARGAAGASSPDPLAALEDNNKALRQKLLAVPALRERYLRYVGDIAELWLDWNRLGPLVEGYRQVIAEHVRADTRKHDTFDAFVAGIDGPPDAAPPPTSLRGFAEQRRAFLLAHPEVMKARR